MEISQMYIIKSIIALSVMFCFYWVMLRNETLFSWNRRYLLFSMIIALVIPFLKITFNQSTDSEFANLVFPVTINNYTLIYNSLQPIKSLNLLSIIYISGAVLLSLRFLSGILRIYYLYWRYPKYKLNGFKAVILDRDLSPFTFFNILFISRNDFKNGGINEIIVHEKAHKEAFHSFDIILLEIVTIIQWFNPIVWIFRRALKSEHEFFADNKVVNEGYDKFKYQQMLFNKSFGITSLNLTNNFKYSFLKKRLKMMTTNKQGSKVKYVFALPVILLLIFSFSINFEMLGQNPKAYDKVDILPKYQGEDIDKSVTKFIAENVKYPREAQENKVTAKIYVQCIIDLKGEVTDVLVKRTDILNNKMDEVVVVGYKPSDATSKENKEAIDALEKEAIRVIKMLKGFTPGIKDGKKVSTYLTFPINFVLK